MVQHEIVLCCTTADALVMTRGVEFGRRPGRLDGWPSLASSVSATALSFDSSPGGRDSRQRLWQEFSYRWRYG